MRINMYPQTEYVSFNIGSRLYEEIFEVEIEPYDIEIDVLEAPQIQCIQGMLNAEKIIETGQFHVTMTNDGVEYLIRVLLPESMERWYTCAGTEGVELLEEVRIFLSYFGVTYPF